MTTITHRPGKWVRAYGGRINHLVVGSTKENSIGLSRLVFACGKQAQFTQWGFDGLVGYCTKCERAQQTLALDAVPAGDTAQ